MKNSFKVVECATSSVDGKTTQRTIRAGLKSSKAEDLCDKLNDRALESNNSPSILSYLIQKE